MARRRFWNARAVLLWVAAATVALAVAWLDLWLRGEWPARAPRPREAAGAPTEVEVDIWYQPVTGRGRDSGNANSGDNDR